MTMDFSNLKKNRASAIEQLDQQLKNLNSNGYDKDSDEYWQPTVDKAGNGYAEIRFLPAPPNEDVPFVRLWSHSFKGPNTDKWYIENCLTTLGKDDPCAEYASELWNTGLEENKELVRKLFKRRLSYISNVYIVNDPSNPDNNGKVFKFKYGKKIWDKLNYLMNPEFPGEEKVNPFDFWEGANFYLKIRKVEGYRNYDKSEFAKPAPLHSDDEALESIWKQQYSLAKVVDPENFKSYDELKKRLYIALGKTEPRSNGSSVSGSSSAPAEKEMSFKPKFGESDAPKVGASSSSSFEDDDDDASSFFSNLMSDD